MRFIVGPVLLSFLIPCVVAAQRIEAGARVRLGVPCDVSADTCRIAGTLASVGGDSVAIATADRRIRFHVDDVRSVEASRGERTHRWAGAGIGFVAGAATTFLVLNGGGSTSVCNRSENQDAVRPIECAGLVALGGLVTAGAGAIVGGLVRTERWEALPLGRIRVGVAEVRDGGVGLAIRVRGR